MGVVTNQDNVRAQSKLTQVKVSVDPQIASAFKQACAATNISMAAELTRFMADYSGNSVKRKAASAYSTRRQRRTAIRKIIKDLEQMKSFEERVRDNTPENLQASYAYEATEDAVVSLEDALEALCSFWMVP